MPEIKHTFSKGRMNKDLDERLVPNGEYRNALNIEVTTSEDSDVGAVQTVLGNKVPYPDAHSKLMFLGDGVCVGSIADEKNDKIYWLATDTNVPAYTPIATLGAGPAKRVNAYKIRDIIVELAKDANDNFDITPVLVDVHTVVATVHYNSHPTGTEVMNGIQAHNHFHVSNLQQGSINKTGIRPGMYITGTFTHPGTPPTNLFFNQSIPQTITLTEEDGVVVDRLEYNAPNNGWDVYWRYEGNEDNPVHAWYIGSTEGEIITFKSKKALNFDKDRFITGINIIDDILFWTDNFSEPKKVHIERSKIGTNNFEHHTHFHVFDADDNLVTANNSPVPIEEEHITVIKKAPLAPPTLEMSNTVDIRGNIVGDFEGVCFSDVDGNSLNVSDVVNVTSTTPLDYRVGDILLLSQDPDVQNTVFTKHDIRVSVVKVFSSSSFDIKILSIRNKSYPPSIPGSLVGNSDYDWFVTLEQGEPLFEFKFPRFAYRYRFQDGEYSPFSPFSEVAFLPSDFSYEPKEGYNLGMTNNLRYLKIMDFVPEAALRPRGVIAVDVLYKESNSPNVYTVKTINSTDPEWTADGSAKDPNTGTYFTTLSLNKGALEIQSEMIHAAVPQNQMFRPWDNVPRKALAQEISGNRLIYANYLQNFNVKDALINGEEINVNVNASVESLNIVSATIPKKSLKSLRTYQLGVVYRDSYGRETPVLTDQKSSFDVVKSLADNENSIVAKINSKKPYWADSYKFFVKETSNEYYNLALDRWYEAEDGNIWLSFPSTERNKIDIETFLILKKEHDNSNFVEDDARYKVIAIENDAPEYIKLNKRSLGKVSLSYEASGAATEDQTFVHVTDATFNNSAFGSNALDGLRGLKLRIYTGTASSNFYEIANIVSVSNSTSGAGKRINFTQPLKEDVTNVSSNGQGSINTEIIQEEEKNKPEFDGRFFVKILGEGPAQKFIKDNVKTVTPTFSVSDTILHYFLNHNNSNAYCAGDGRNQSWWKNDWNRHAFFIDAESRADVGSGNPFPKDSGFGIETNRRKTDGPCGYNTYITQVGRVTMEFSFSGIKDHEKSKGGAPGGTGMSFDKHQTEKQQWNKLKTPGTMFRWKEDPDQVVYRVINGTDSRDVAAHGVGILNYGKGNKDRKQWMNKTRRLYMNFESTGWRMDFPLHDAQNGSSAVYEFYDAEEGINPKDNSWSIGPTGFKPTMQGWDNTVGSGNFVTTSIGHSSASSGPTASATTTNSIEIVEIFQEDQENLLTSTNPAIFETEPKEDVGLDIYYEVGQAYPTALNSRTNELFAPIGSKIKSDWVGEWDSSIFTAPVNLFQHNNGDTYFDTTNNTPYPLNDGDPIKLFIPDGAHLRGWEDNIATLSIYASQMGFTNINTGVTYVGVYSGSDTLTFPQPNQNMIPSHFASGSGIFSADIQFLRPDGSYTTAKVAWWRTNPLGTSNRMQIIFDRNVHAKRVRLHYFNCYAFGNGVESDRIRDAFNAVRIDKGVKASTVIATPYEEERRGNGLIFSGIYNSTTGINELNQFISAENITKDVNPRFGTIQKLHSRDTNLITICEDKVLNILANKDALFNADGNTNVTASSNVLGQPTPYSGEWGISKNPESFASQAYRAYFTDKSRGAVLRLSKDGLTPISEVGMKDYFSDNLKNTKNIIGSHDDKKNTYNITFKDKDKNDVTVSYSENSGGWTSFKSFIKEGGLSMNNTYYTFKKGIIWRHHEEDVDRGSFYDLSGAKLYDSDITILFNDQPGSVKSFNTLNYEGSQARITRNIDTGIVLDAAGNSVSTFDKEYYNNEQKTGWYLESAETDLQSTGVMEFKDKENKWFAKMKGDSTYWDEDGGNVDTKEFSVQGIDMSSSISTEQVPDREKPVQPPAPVQPPEPTITTPEPIVTTPEPIPGCTDPTALNYNPQAEVDDGSCVYEPTQPPPPPPVTNNVVCIRSVHTPAPRVTVNILEGTGITSTQIGTNTNPTEIQYQGSVQSNVETEIFRITFTADNLYGVQHYFATPPTYSIVSGDPVNFPVTGYNVIENDTFIPGSNTLQQREFIVKLTTNTNIDCKMHVITFNN